jgi:hypothetical protein
MHDFELDVQWWAPFRTVHQLTQRRRSLAMGTVDAEMPRRGDLGRAADRCLPMWRRIRHERRPWCILRDALGPYQAAGVAAGPIIR